MAGGPGVFDAAMGCDGGLIREALNPENLTEEGARRHPIVEPIGKGDAAALAQRALGMTARGCLIPREMMRQRHQTVGCQDGLGGPAVDMAERALGRMHC